MQWSIFFYILACAAIIWLDWRWALAATLLIWLGVLFNK